MADDWNKYLPKEWGGISYWKGRFNDQTYNPKSWYEHADRWLYELKKGAYDNEWNYYERDYFFYYLHRHFEDCQKQNLQQYQRNLENNQRPLSAWQWQNQLNQNQFTGWYNNLNQREQNLQQNQSNLENNQRQLSVWQNQLNQQQYDLDRREQDLHQNQRKFENALKQLNQQKEALAEKSRQLNLMEERLNKREVELKLREQKLERMESAGKNNSYTSQGFQVTINDNHFQSKISGFDRKSREQKLERMESAGKNNSYTSQGFQVTINDNHFQSKISGFDSIEQSRQTVSIDKTPAYTQNTRQSPEVKPAPTQKVSISAKDEFNEMMNKTGQDFRQARQNFIKNRNVRAFKCSNSSARMRTPVPPPIFGEVDEISEGDFWAVKIQGNKFDVFPNVKNYTNNHHEERAMGDVFDSNFVPGKVYKNIYVEQPAIFDCDGSSWRLLRKGKLKLE